MGLKTVQILETLVKVAFVSKTYQEYKKKHPRTKKRPADFEHPVSKTHSGKHIFKHYDHPKHKNFGVKDHKDAWEHHVLEKNKAEHKLHGLNNEHPNAPKLHKKVQFHDAQAVGHMGELEKMRSKRKKASHEIPEGPFTLSVPIFDDMGSRVPSRTQKINVQDLAQASKQYQALRDKSGLGGSQFGSGSVLKNGKEVAHVSYNGRVWIGPKGSVKDYEKDLLMEAQ